MEFQPHHQDDWSIISKENKTKIEDLWKELEPNNLEIPNTKEEYPCSEINQVPGYYIMLETEHLAAHHTSWDVWSMMTMRMMWNKITKYNVSVMIWFL